MKSRIAGSFVSSGTGKASDRIAAYGQGRICMAPGCSTLLSNYNPGVCCSVHAAFCPSPFRQSRT